MKWCWHNIAIILHYVNKMNTRKSFFFAVITKFIYFVSSLNVLLGTKDKGRSSKSFLYFILFFSYTFITLFISSKIFIVISLLMRLCDVFSFFLSFMWLTTTTIYDVFFNICTCIWTVFYWVVWLIQNKIHNFLPFFQVIVLKQQKEKNRIK